MHVDQQFGLLLFCSFVHTAVQCGSLQQVTVLQFTLTRQTTWVVARSCNPSVNQWRRHRCLWCELGVRLHLIPARVFSFLSLRIPSVPPLLPPSPTLTLIAYDFLQFHRLSFPRPANPPTPPPPRLVHRLHHQTNTYIIQNGNERERETQSARPPHPSSSHGATTNGGAAFSSSTGVGSAVDTSVTAVSFSLPCMQTRSLATPSPSQSHRRCCCGRGRGGRHTHAERGLGRAHRHVTLKRVNKTTRARDSLRINQ